MSTCIRLTNINQGHADIKKNGTYLGSVEQSPGAKKLWRPLFATPPHDDRSESDVTTETNTPYTFSIPRNENIYEYLDIDNRRYVLHQRMTNGDTVIYEVFAYNRKDAVAFILNDAKNNYSWRDNTIFAKKNPDALP